MFRHKIPNGFKYIPWRSVSSVYHLKLFTATICRVSYSQMKPSKSLSKYTSITLWLYSLTRGLKTWIQHLSYTLSWAKTISSQFLESTVSLSFPNHLIYSITSYLNIDYTCFANKLSRLTRLRGPIRSMASPNDLLPENSSINAPREIMRLVNWMMACTLNTVRS